MRLLFSYFIGLLFGLGITFSGMINPKKVQDFFDIFGSWDPSLAFVMLGALSVNFIGYRLVSRRAKPLFENSFAVPERARITPKLVFGSLTFGVGWGLSGICPGAILPAASSGNLGFLLFLTALFVGFMLSILAERYMRIAKIKNHSSTT